MESLTMAYHRFHKVETRIVRIFNTYGPRMRLNDGRVIPTFIGQILENKPLTIFGDGSQTRSFCYVDDLIEGIFRIAMSDHHYPINLGNPEEISINQLAKELCEIESLNLTIKKKKLLQGDPLKRKPEITKAKNILRWKPKISRKKVLQKTIDFFKRNSEKMQVSMQPKTFKAFIQR